MRLSSLMVVALTLSLATACTNNITEVQEVYPAILHAPQGIFEMSAGMSYGFGASATIVGKDHYEVGDSISVVVSNPSVVRIKNDVTIQSRCSTTDGIPAVCLQRSIAVEGLKLGQTLIIFKLGASADTLTLSVTQGKG